MLVSVDVWLPYEATALLAECYEFGRVLSVDYHEEGDPPAGAGHPVGRRAPARKPEVVG
jgi:hypothetical protein